MHDREIKTTCIFIHFKIKSPTCNSKNLPHVYIVLLQNANLAITNVPKSRKVSCYRGHKRRALSMENFKINHAVCSLFDQITYSSRDNTYVSVTKTHCNLNMFQYKRVSN